jgi:nitrate reductase delta subunit
MSVATARIIASTLLLYPDEDFMSKRKEMEAVAKKLDTSFGEPLLEFLEETWAMAELQRHYVEIFDMRRRCSLFLTSWTHGDTRNRGMALIYFKELYKNAGVTMSEEELPDHLAVVLEFAALVDPIEGNLLLGEHRAPIELIRDALHAAHSVYAHILDSVVTTLPPMTAEIQERARAIALSGPPQEFVGLSGAVSIALEPFSAFPSLERTHK